jgi:hypothetical protein
MAEKGCILGWSAKQYRKARDVLVERGFLRREHEGGRGARGVSGACGTALEEGSMSETFDANRRLAEVALWIDGSALGMDWATEAARPDTCCSTPARGSVWVIDLG